MERAAFTLLHESEKSWWYRGRALIVRNLLARHLPTVPLSVLDFGAGYGGMEVTLARHGSVVAYEPDSLVRGVLAERGYSTIYDTPSAALASSYDLIALFDVLEHMEDDEGFLRKAHTALQPGGMLVLTVPAMPFLWSAHDVTHHHYRRYTKQSLRKVLEENGYEPVSMSYWNMFLFIPAALARLLGRSGEGSFHLPQFIDALFYTLIRIEAFCMRILPLPFGVSLVVVAHKK